MSWLNLAELLVVFAFASAVAFVTTRSVRTRRAKSGQVPPPVRLPQWLRAAVTGTIVTGVSVAVNMLHPAALAWAAAALAIIVLVVVALPWVADGEFIWRVGRQTAADRAGERL